MQSIERREGTKVGTYVREQSVATRALLPAAGKSS